MISKQDLEEFHDALIRQIDYLEHRAKPGARPRCFIQARIHGDCAKCKVCPLFLPEDHPKVPHPCWHLVEPRTQLTIWKCIQCIEEGKISRLEYNILFCSFAINVFQDLKSKVKLMLDNFEQCKDRLAAFTTDPVVEVEPESVAVAASQG